MYLRKRSFLLSFLSSPNLSLEHDIVYLFRLNLNDCDEYSFVEYEFSFDELKRIILDDEALFTC